MKFEIFQGKNGQWYWRLKAANSQIVAQSEAYTRKADAARACKSILAAFSVTRKVVQIKVIE